MDLYSKPKDLAYMYIHQHSRNLEKKEDLPKGIAPPNTAETLWHIVLNSSHLALHNSLFQDC